MAYVLRLEELRQAAGTAMLAAVLARSQGSEVEMPDLEKIRADFDAALAAPPEAAANPEQFALMQALGLRD